MAQSAQWFMELAPQILSGTAAYTEPPINSFLEETGGFEDADILLVQMAYGFAPEPVTPNYIYRRGPYGSPERPKQQLDGAVERGWLQVVGEDQYTLTPRGQEVTAELFALFDGTFSGFETLPDADLERSAALLGKVVEQVRAMPELGERWSFSWGVKFDRGPDAAPLIKVRRGLIDLLSLRDDVHITAWQPYDVGGQLWETLTYVWRGDAGTAAELVEQLPYRGLDEASYAAALQDLVSRGWAAEEDGAYVITEQGKNLRQEAEDATNRYYDAPWVALSEAEMEELRGLLEKLAEVVKPPEEDSTED